MVLTFQQRCKHNRQEPLYDQFLASHRLRNCSIRSALPFMHRMCSHSWDRTIIPRPRFFTCVIQWFLPSSNAANIIDKNHYTTIRSYLLRNSFIISKISWQLPSVTSTFSGRIGSCRDFRRRHQPFTSGRSKLIRTPS